MNKSIIFDLDDTLYYEVDFLKSAFSEISQIVSDEISVDSSSIYRKMIKAHKKNINVFTSIKSRYQFSLSIEDLIQCYRNHVPLIYLDKKTEEVLYKLKDDNYRMGLLTDGRSVQQRNKIKSLKLDRFFKEYLISEEFGSEKPCLDNYLFFSKHAFVECSQFYYVGDNIKKDFISPNSLGWTTICLMSNGKNIHSQNLNVGQEFLPQFYIKNFSDILEII
tara:strand:+ start:58 stop:717 length:660 start_codon:yes stop_codon:yes gene_type:complete